VKRIVTELGFPVVAFAVNPFIHDGYKIADNRSALYRVVKSLGMNYKFAVCAQPLKGEMITFKSIFGRCNQDREAKMISEKVYALFKIPVCKLHVQKIEDRAYLSGLEPLGKGEISAYDLRTISEETSLISKQGEPFSG
jgi:hypothetical protein